MVLGEVPATLSLLARAGQFASLDVATLLAGYGKGLYPRATFGGQEWWAPEARMVLFLDRLQVGARVVQKLSGGLYRISFDTAFDAVVRECAGVDGRRGSMGRTTPELVEAYQRAHRAGAAHSLELWDYRGRLAGGIYGLSVGRIFFTEARFSARPGAGRLVLAALNRHLKGRGYLANVNKHPAGALYQDGYRLVRRAPFDRFLAKACAGPAALGRWPTPDRGEATGLHRLAEGCRGAA